MFSKHVWYDRKHQAEVYSTAEGIISGTLMAWDGAATMINPRPEVLLALYQEGKIRRILSVRAIILTTDAIEYTRGLCAFVNYCRGLRRRTPLVIVSRSSDQIAHDYLSSCCARLWGDSEFELEFQLVGNDEPVALGKGSAEFISMRNDSASAYLRITTDRNRRLHYYDEAFDDAPDEEQSGIQPAPDVAIRASRLPTVLHGEKVLDLGS